MTTSNYCVVSTTLETEKDATELARLLVEARLAACVQQMPVNSTYRWQGKLQSADERLLLIKTRTDATDRLIDFIKTHHPYDTPEIIATPITTATPEYLHWIDEQID